MKWILETKPQVFYFIISLIFRDTVVPPPPSEKVSNGVSPSPVLTIEHTSNEGLQSSEAKSDPPVGSLFHSHSNGHSNGQSSVKKELSTEIEGAKERELKQVRFNEEIKQEKEEENEEYEDLEELSLEYGPPTEEKVVLTVFLNSPFSFWIQISLRKKKRN